MIDDVTGDHGPLCGYGSRCPDCGWPVPPEHDAAIAARALREAADAMLNEKGVTFADVLMVAWLRERAEQVNG